MSSSPSYVVSTIKRALGLSARIRRMVSTPLIPGSRKSIKVMSGLCWRWSSIASSPFPAWATQTISGDDPTRVAIPIRIMGWSSTIRMRMEAMPNYIFDTEIASETERVRRGSGYRDLIAGNGDGQSCPLIQPGPDFDASAKTADPFLKALQSVMPVRRHCRRVKALAVVDDHHMECLRRK